MTSLTEIKALIADKALTSQPLDKAMMKAITWDDQWLACDDEDTIAMKINYANSHCFDGTMAWSVDLDSGIGQSSSPPVSTDNTCGAKNGLICPSGQCCSGGGVSPFDRIMTNLY
jgi:GH18 family chitinase